ncbi:MAG: S1 RNA-binding domain-containing protein, partial [Longimicrobiales bacterium]
SWTKRVQHPSEVLRKGDDVQVVVLGVDPENKRISLGLKQTQEDPWDSLAGQYGAGVEKTGTVVRLLEDGVVVDLGDDVEGFIPRSQLVVPENEQVENYIRDGISLELRVLEFDGANRRIVLTPTQTLERQPGEAPKPAPVEGESVEEPGGESEAERDGAPAGREAAASGVEGVGAESEAEGMEPRQPVDSDKEPASQEQA